MKRLSKGFYLGSIIGGMVCGIILSVVLVVALIFFVFTSIYSGDFQDLSGISPETLAIGILLVFLALAAMIFGLVIWYILFYRAWEAIQDGNARTTPGKAIGFSFIPFFNLYWIFVVWYGFAKDYNRYIERHAITASKLNENLFLAYCILSICSAIPYLNYLVLLPVLVIFIIMANAIIDAVNALPTDLPVGTANQ